MHRLLNAIAAASVLALAGCGAQGASEADMARRPTSADTQATLPDGLFLDAAPADAVPLREARVSAMIGDTIAFTGYIGGRAAPFTEGRALFLVADEVNAPACTDGCKTPWDACCTPGDTIAANSATVQLLDETGKLFAIGLNGCGGLEPGAGVAVVGKVRQVGESVFIVDANGLAVIKGK